MLIGFLIALGAVFVNICIGAIAACCWRFCLEDLKKFYNFGAALLINFIYFLTLIIVITISKSLLCEKAWVNVDS
jgi:hypothetical protein